MAHRGVALSNSKVFPIVAVVILMVGLVMTYSPQHGVACTMSTTSGTSAQPAPDSGFTKVAYSPSTGQGNTGQADAGSDVVDGSLYVVGGYGCTSDDRLNTVSVYSPGNDSWRLGPSYPVEAWGISCSAIGEALFCFGGDGAGIQAYKLDTHSSVWTRLHDLPSGFENSQGQVSVSDPNDSQVFIMGSSNNQEVSNQVWAYDIIHDSYSRKADMPQPNGWFSAALYQGGIYTIGGIHGSGVLMYDLGSDSWSQVESSLPGPWRFGMIRNPGVASGLIPIVDGSHGGSVFYNQTYFYDITNNRFIRGPDTLLPRDGIAGGIIDGTLYVAGGRNDSAQPKGLTLTEKLDLDSVFPNASG